MASKFEKKTVTKNQKAMARPVQSSERFTPDKITRLHSPSPSNLDTDSPKSSLEKLDRADNSLGETFRSGDLIQVKDLKGSLTTAKIQYFLPVASGTMAVYTPAEEQETAWEWERGCRLIDALVRA